MGTSSQSHDDVHLKILPTLLEALLRHLSYCHGKGFHEGYDRKLMSSQILNAITILSLDSTSSEKLLLN